MFKVARNFFPQNNHIEFGLLCCKTDSWIISSLSCETPEQCYRKWWDVLCLPVTLEILTGAFFLPQSRPAVAWLLTSLYHKSYSIPKHRFPILKKEKKSYLSHFYFCLFPVKLQLFIAFLDLNIFSKPADPIAAEPGAGCAAPAQALPPHVTDIHLCQCNTY